MMQTMATSENPQEIEDAKLQMGAMNGTLPQGEAPPQGEENA